MNARHWVWAVILALAISIAFCDVGSGSFWILLGTLGIDGSIGAYLLHGFSAFDGDKDRKAMLENRAAFDYLRSRQVKAALPKTSPKLRRPMHTAPGGL